MGNDLRLLILCDYIKKDYKRAVGNPNLDVHALGVIPYFELLRRENQEQNKDLKLSVLCGSVAIIPSSAKSRLLELAPDPLAISFKTIGNLSEEEYVEVDVRGNRHFLTGIITQLFEEGYMEVLIGTKSLLGEGWDSPCVNSLILASFVGSFMLSNQMRGRAIRTYAKNPNKASNIWHLVCILPQKLMQEADRTNQLQLQVQEENQDMEMLTRRMENFLGLHYELDSIESGIGRLSAIQYPIEEKKNIKTTNTKMLELSSERDKLKSRWDKSLLAMSKMEVVDEVCKDTNLVTVVALYDHLRYLLLSTIFSIVSRSALVGTTDLTGIVASLITMIFFSSIFMFCLSSVKLMKFLNPLKCLQKLGEGVRQALITMNQFETSDHRVETKQDHLLHLIYLVGGSGHDKALFAQCLSEMSKDIENQRYLLYAPRRTRQKDGYFPVPEIFSKRREDADLFASYMKKYMGNYKVIYTRNVEGRKILLKGRKYAMANQQNRVIQRKRVKGALE